MRIKVFQSIGELKKIIIAYKIKKRDKQLLVESIIITAIYLLSFLILSLGRVQQEFLGISQGIFSNIQIITLTFFFASIITFIIYSLYKKVRYGV
ncbi:MAG: hypothetical protein AABY00_01250 [Nanoarchaeota archaeon]